MSLNEKLSLGIEEDVDVMLDYMLQNKMYDNMAKCLSMLKPSYNEKKWKEYFAKWENGQHEQKYVKPSGWGND